MTFDDTIVQSTTQDFIVPKVVDTVLGGNVLTMRLMSNPQKWRGEAFKVPVKVSSSSANGSFDGFDLFSTTQAATRKNMSFGLKGFYQSVTVSGMQRAVNQGTEAVLDLVQVEMESAQADMASAIGTLLYLDGTGNSSKDFLGLKALVDDGTVAATYGGLSRSTYTTLQSTRTASIGALTLSGMATLYDAATVGSDRPTIIVTTETVWGYYEQLLQPSVVANFNAAGYAQVTSTNTVQNRAALSGDRGFDALYYRGTPMVKDEKCTSGYMYFLNENYIGFYVADHPDGMNAPTSPNKLLEGAYSQPDTKLSPMRWTGWKMPTNQDAMVGQFIIYGEVINRNPNRSSVGLGITSV